MVSYNPSFTEKPFAFSFDSVNYDRNPPKLKSLRFTEENFKHTVKMFEVLHRIVADKVTWRGIPTSPLLYSGARARPIKEVTDNAIKNIIHTQFSGELGYSPYTECYPSYLSVTKEIRLFGYQWKGVFKVVLIDFNHKVLPRS